NVVVRGDRSRLVNVECVVIQCRNYADHLGADKEPKETSSQPPDRPGARHAVSNIRQIKDGYCCEKAAVRVFWLSNAITPCREIASTERRAAILSGLMPFRLGAECMFSHCGASTRVDGTG